MNKGTWFAIGAYLIWGVVPAFWKLLRHVKSVELLGHRVIWSFLILALVMALRRQWENFRRTALNWRVVRIYILAAFLIGANWLTYVWAVNAGFVVETSLGYFINPLLSILMGVIILRERIRPLQWVPIGLATIGVLYLTFVYGELPWIALVLAFTFGFYGLVKKVAPLNSQYGLTMETGILFLPAVGYLGFSAFRGNLSFSQAGIATDVLLIFGGVVTVVPLLMFAAAARLVPLSQIGILQFIAPIMQFLIGVFVFGEPFSWEKSIGFIIIWAALLLYAGEGFMNRRLIPKPELNA